MVIDYNLVSTVDILGLLQGVVLGSFLLSIGRKENRTRLFLALFIISYSLGLLPGVLEELKVLEILSTTNFTPFNFNWILFPLFFIYVQSVSILSRKMILWPLKVAFLGMALETGFFFISVYLEIDFFFFQILILILEFGFGILVGFMIVYFINKHIKEVNNQYSLVTNKELLWAKSYVIIGICYTIIIIPFSFFLDDRFVYVLFSFTNVVLLYWVSLKGVFQTKVPSLISKNELGSSEVDCNMKPSNQAQNFMTLEEMKEIMVNAKKYLYDTEAYTKLDLTISDLATALSVHSKRLSASINHENEANFNTYINEYRVEKAKQMLCDKKYSNLSVEGIGIEVGFQSKTTFYSAFKNKTNSTPNRYRKEYSDQICTDF